MPAARWMCCVGRRSAEQGGVFRVACFAPANDLTPELRERYEANRLTVVASCITANPKPGDSLDLVLLVNRIPTASAG